MTEEAQTPEAPTEHPVPPVTGYRPLTDADVALMNRIKDAGTALMVLVEEVSVAVQAKGNALWAEEQNASTLLRAAEQAGEPEHIQRMQANMEQVQRKIVNFQRSEAMRWLSIGRTDVQTGVMAIVRAVAQPDSLI
ncbi:hypothetical protein GTB64_004441 [Salmonella enterica]|nr:hypothetical protein [Salmonella enterica]